MDDDVVKGTTCFAEHRRLNVACLKRECRFNINHAPGLNCSLLTTEPEIGMTLFQIEKIYNESRFTVNNIVKRITRKIKRQLLEQNINEEE